METESPMSFREEALRVVRQTLEAVLNGRPQPVFSFADPRFAERCGVFVTLKRHGELRGCIGFVKGVEPLSAALPEMAVAAATHDPRFAAVRAEELAEISLEVSVLTPMTEVSDVSEIEIGKHGLMLINGHRSGLLLPQVPVEWGWDVDEFLSNLCHKAGLPPGAHLQPGARLLKFSADVFSED
ncbi:MAG TPA: AmmeMemoRadiSam system protein A [Candidatus Rifleibacterium sp.]|nr:AmmeMemoRadiSam system protein A [Candidatus Rifleibacterium sp.]HPT48517.1 AmmeMemoRadiSam system protein A [Candidatus Rifleibacterium sp.]